MKVLLVDDEVDIRRIAALSLSGVGGMEVAQASGGSEGIRKAREDRPDVILLDMMMPGLDGLATFQALRSDPETSAIPVIFLTAKAMSAEVDRLRALGARGVLIKPFDPMALPRLLRDLVSGQPDEE
ncbi:MAG TPA: response regulator [Thermoanaerobaculia bacterium]|nr:response regulator [Thermoanaerobaculia bacterium]